MSRTNIRVMSKEANPSITPPWTLASTIRFTVTRDTNQRTYLMLKVITTRFAYKYNIYLIFIMDILSYNRTRFRTYHEQSGQLGAF
jgi:hypothetical protein